MKEYAFGVDIGGTSIKMGLFRTDGHMEDKWEIPTRTEQEGAYILADIAASARKKLEEKKLSLEEIQGMGLGVPGTVDDRGTVLRCVNLGWGVLNVEEEMSKFLDGIRVKAANDANVAALGEMWKGGGNGCENMVMVTLGTGVGGGIILNGQIVAGAGGAGGEIGHFPMKTDETQSCGCGKQGCLEQYASARGIARMGREKLESDSRDTLLRSVPELTAKDIFDAAKAGDQVALELVEELGEILGRALAFVSCVTDPERYVIGGGVSKAGTIVTDVIGKYFRQYAFHACRNATFALAELGNDAGMYGSVKLVL